MPTLPVGPGANTPPQLKPAADADAPAQPADDAQSTATPAVPPPSTAAPWEDPNISKPAAPSAPTVEPTHIGVTTEPPHFTAVERTSSTAPAGDLKDADLLAVDQALASVPDKLPPLEESAPAAAPAVQATATSSLPAVPMVSPSSSTPAQAEAPADAPAETTTDAPADKPTEAPADKPTDAPAAEPATESVKKTTDEPAEMSAEAKPETPAEPKSDESATPATVTDLASVPHDKAPEDTITTATDEPKLEHHSVKIHHTHKAKPHKDDNKPEKATEEDKVDKELAKSEDKLLHKSHAHESQGVTETEAHVAVARHGVDAQEVHQPVITQRLPTDSFEGPTPAAALAGKSHIVVNPPQDSTVATDAAPASDEPSSADAASALELPKPDEAPAAQSAPEPSVTEAPAEAASEPAVEPEAAPAAEPDAAPTVAETEPEPAAEPASEPEPETQPDVAPAAEPSAESAPEIEPTPESEPSSEPASEPQPQPESQPEPEPQSEPAAEPSVEAVPAEVAPTEVAPTEPPATPSLPESEPVSELQPVTGLGSATEVAPTMPPAPAQVPVADAPSVAASVAQMAPAAPGQPPTGRTVTPVTHPKPIDRKIVLIAMVGGAILIALAVLVYFMFAAPSAGKSGDATPSPTTAAVTESHSAVLGADATPTPLADPVGGPAARDAQRKTDLGRIADAYRVTAKNGFFATIPPAISVAPSDPATQQPYKLITSGTPVLGSIGYLAGQQCSGQQVTPGKSSTRFVALTIALETDPAPYCLNLNK